ncbi:MAG: CDC27 family protein [Bacillota bacterium]
MKWSEYTEEEAEEAIRLMEEGLSQLKAEEYDEAEDSLKRALSLCPAPPVINNLATCYLHSGKYEEAVAVLEPNLLDLAPNPFAHATAARCLVALGRPREAAAAAETAVRHFEAGRPTRPGWMMRREGAEWYEYVVPILKAFGDLGEHRRVWQLYQDWQTGIREPIAHFYAGIAAFNLGRFSRAEAVWRRLKAPEWDFVDPFCFMARLRGSDDVPVPVLNYETPFAKVHEMVSSLGEDENWEGVVRWFVAHPADLMIVLSTMFSGGKAQSQIAAIEYFVEYGGEWGEQFGRHLLTSRLVSDGYRMAAAGGLLERGAIGPGTPIEMLVEGELREVVMKKMAIEPSFEATPELREQYEELCLLYQEGEFEQVREQLERLIHVEEVAWVNVLLLYGNVLRKTEDFEQAAKWLEMLDDFLPENPVVLLSLARLRFAQGLYDEAEQLLSEIEMTDVIPESRPEIEEERDALLGHLRLLRLSAMLTAESATQMRERAEDKPLDPGRTTLGSALRKVPVGWLDAACGLHDLRGLASRRRGREEQLAEWMLENPAEALVNLFELFPDEFDEALDLLSFLLEEGGWVKKMRVTRRYGRDDDDGFFWLEDPPISVLGFLRMAGFVFVGRTVLDGKRWKVVVIPIDLRDRLREALDCI